MMEHGKARENTPPSRPSNTQPVSQNQLASVIPCPTPIRSMPQSIRPPSQAAGLGNVSAPNQDSAPWVQTEPTASSSLVPAQSSTMVYIVAKFRKELDQMAYDRFGFMPKARTYTKPYPGYFDLQPYPPGY